MSPQPNIAVIGAGARGMHAASTLVHQGAYVDVFDSRPAPYGLINSGIPRLRLFGNVRIGRDMTISELKQLYDDVIVIPQLDLTSPARARTTWGKGQVTRLLESRKIPYTSWNSWNLTCNPDPVRLEEWAARIEQARGVPVCDQ